MNNEKLKLEELKEVIEFGKFGFKDILASGFGGIFLVISLAILDAFTEFNIKGIELVILSAIFLAGTVAFGFLSLRKLPELKVDIQNGQATLTSQQTSNNNGLVT